MQESPASAARTLGVRAFALTIVLACALGAGAASPSAPAVAATEKPTRPRAVSTQPYQASPAEPALSAAARWSWPVAGRRVVARAFLAPPHAYGPGHRGIDLRADDAAANSAGGAAVVLAPADGVVAFVGTVVDRSLVTLDHGNGLVSTLEPVDASVAHGQRVTRGEAVGLLSGGGHASAGTLHLGVRLDGEYVNPLLFLGGVERARLLPLE